MIQRLEGEMPAAEREAPRTPVLKRYGRPSIAETAGDEAEGSPASMPPPSG
jgi:hypothetical protein